MATTGYPPSDTKINGHTISKPFGEPPKDYNPTLPGADEKLFLLDAPRGLDEFAKRAIEAHIKRGSSDDLPGKCDDDDDDDGGHGHSSGQHGTKVS